MLNHCLTQMYSSSPFSYTHSLSGPTTTVRFIKEAFTHLTRAPTSVNASYSYYCTHNPTAFHQCFVHVHCTYNLQPYGELLPAIYITHMYGAWSRTYRQIVFALYTCGRQTRATHCGGPNTAKSQTCPLTLTRATRHSFCSFARPYNVYNRPRARRRVRGVGAEGGEKQVPLRPCCEQPRL